MYLTLYTHLKVSQLFSKPLFSPVSSALSLPYIYPHTLSVFRLLFISGNFGVACLFFLRFFFLLPQVFVFPLRLTPPVAVHNFL